VVGQTVTERNAGLLPDGELNNGHLDALLPDEQKGRLGISDKFVSTCNICCKHFL
jgi:hypothetical protein